ncbi:hypothetical protein BDR26DRAFT_989184 [Obelidium mucronatum]|nr:hypothetical protein BDR26DRAFT_989184 [Obelidium mucronatum]
MNQGSSSSSTSKVSANSLTSANDVDEQHLYLPFVFLAKLYIYTNTQNIGLYFVENVLSSMTNVQTPDGGISDFMVDFWKKFDNSIGKLTEHTNTLMLIILMFGHMTKIAVMLQLLINNKIEPFTALDLCIRRDKLDDWEVADFEALVSAKLSSIQPRVQRQQGKGKGRGKAAPKEKNEIEEDEDFYYGGNSPYNSEARGQDSHQKEKEYSIEDIELFKEWLQKKESFNWESELNLESDSAKPEDPTQSSMNNPEPNTSTNLTTSIYLSKPQISTWPLPTIYTEEKNMPISEILPTLASS